VKTVQSFHYFRISNLFYSGLTCYVNLIPSVPICLFLSFNNVGVYLLQISIWFIKINPLETEFQLNNIYKFSPYLTGNIFRLRYKAQPVNAVYGNSGTTQIHCVGRMQSFSVLKQVVHIVVLGFKRLILLQTTHFIAIN
jgi:hypothetical protein